MNKLKEYFKNLIADFSIETESYRLLSLLVVADFLFIVLHVFFLLGYLNRDFSLVVDSSFAEVYQYIKEYWIAILLLILGIRKKRIIYFAWSLLFTYLLLDDSMGIHEVVGEYLVNNFNIQPMFGLRAQDFGELAVSAVFGGGLLLFVGISYFFSSLNEKKISRYLILFIIILAFFGVAIDMLHAILRNGNIYVFQAFGMIEDGGEMIIMSITLFYVFHLDFSKKKITE